MSATTNGVANGNGVHHAAEDGEQRLAQVFPEAHMTLKQADPEIAALVADEKVRQW
jgi:hypothetical protein